MIVVSTPALRTVGNGRRTVAELHALGGAQLDRLAVGDCLGPPRGGRRRVARQAVAVAAVARAVTSLCAALHPDQQAVNGRSIRVGDAGDGRYVAVVAIVCSDRLHIERRRWRGQRWRRRRLRGQRRRRRRRRRLHQRRRRRRLGGHRRRRRRRQWLHRRRKRRRRRSGGALVASVLAFLGLPARAQL